MLLTFALSLLLHVPARADLIEEGLIAHATRAHDCPAFERRAPRDVVSRRRFEHRSFGVGNGFVHLVLATCDFDMPDDVHWGAYVFGNDARRMRRLSPATFHDGAIRTSLDLIAAEFGDDRRTVFTLKRDPYPRCATRETYEFDPYAEDLVLRRSTQVPCEPSNYLTLRWNQARLLWQRR